MTAALVSAAAALARRQARPAIGGRVLDVSGLVVRVSGFPAATGDIAEIETGDGRLPCEIVGFRGDDLLAVPLGPLRMVRPGAPVWRSGTRSEIAVGDGLLGRFIDPFGGPSTAIPRRARPRGWRSTACRCRWPSAARSTAGSPPGSA